MKTMLLAQKDIQKAAELLRSGEIIAFPTETVFGLGIIYDNEAAFERLVSVKQRRGDKPFTLMCASTDDISSYAVVDERLQKVINKFMPGPLTIIVAVKASLPKWVSFSTGFVGIRISSLDYVQELIRTTGKALLVPSANLADQAPALNSSEAMKVFSGKISAIVEGESISAIPSTIIEIKDKIKLIREGEIPFSDIMKVYEETL